MDFELEERRQALVARVGEFCARECPPGFEAELDRTGEFPADLYKKMADSGLLGVPFPAEYGGSDGDILDVVLIAEQLSRSSNTAVNLFLVPVVFGGMMVFLCGTDSQKSELLPRLVKGELKFSFALTEPEAGSDARSIKTSAVEKDGSLVVSGTKYWTTGATVADYIIVVCITSPDADPSLGMSAFLVPRDSEGLQVTPLHKLAGNAFPSCEVVLDEVRVPLENVVGGPSCMNQGWGQLLRTADLERICVAASCVGGAGTIIAECTEFAKTREQFGRPVFKFQAMQHALAEMATRLDAMRWMTYHAAWLKASKQDCFKEICMAKLFCSESLVELARKGMQVFGGRGYSMDYSMQRYLRESYLSLYAGGTSEIQRSIIARFL
jgi:alkylation response protein AidB-like acyl-CoA dehydrogenase